MDIAVAPSSPSPSPRCRDCSGPAHAATGCEYAPGYLVCGPCVRAAWTWIRRHVNEKGGRSGLYFYDHARATSAPASVERSP